jgi:hypothetical protein
MLAARPWHPAVSSKVLPYEKQKEFKNRNGIREG